MIVVVAEGRPGRCEEVTLELLDDARVLADRLAEELWAVVVTSEALVDDTWAKPLAAHGADLVVALRHDAPEDRPEGPSLALAKYLTEIRPRLVLLADTGLGRQAAPFLAVRLGAALIPSLISCRLLDDGKLEATRMAFGRSAHQVLHVEAGVPAVLMLVPGVAGVGRGDGRRPSRVAEVPVHLPEEVFAVRREAYIAADPRSVDISEADRIIAGGRGMGGPEGFRLLEEIGCLLGAAVAASRVAVDLGWVPYERQVGQSGKRVRPELYIACGISGASQHVSGMEGAGTVVVINRDRNAPLFKLAELGLVGDVQEILPKLLEHLKARLQEKEPVV